MEGCILNSYISAKLLSTSEISWHFVWSWLGNWLEASALHNIGVEVVLDQSTMSTWTDSIWPRSLGAEGGEEQEVYGLLGGWKEVVKFQSP